MKKLGRLFSPPAKQQPAAFADSVLVLDLDSTLIYSCDDLEKYFALGIDNNLDMRRSTFRMRLEDADVEDEHWWCAKRPHLAKFLQVARQKFGKVGIWTAAERKYAEAIVSAVSADMGWPDFVWHRSMCERDPDGYLYKPLKKLAKHLRTPVEKLVIVDDTRFTFHDNEQQAIWIPKWAPELTNTGLKVEDSALLDILAAWEVCAARKTVAKTRNTSCLTNVTFSTAPVDADIETSFDEDLE